jgi:hypothetical protein
MVAGSDLLRGGVTLKTDTCQSGSLYGLFKLADEFNQGDAHCSAELHQFHSVNASLSSLTLADPTLSLL